MKAIGVESSFETDGCKRELVALLTLSSWCLVIVVWLFLGLPWGCLQFVIVVFPDNNHLLFLNGSIGVSQIDHHITDESIRGFSY